jgi:phage shock protein C
MSGEKKLYRSQSDRMLGGVCAGLAHYFQVDPLLVRLVFVVLALNGLGVLAYAVLWLVVPDEANRELTGEDLVRANADDIRRQAENFGQTLRGSSLLPVIIGAVLVVVGVGFLLNSFVPWLNPGVLWPVALIAIGAYVLLRRR